MKKYLVQVECSSYRMYSVKAKSKKEAEQKAKNDFTCSNDGAEVHETVRFVKTEDYGSFSLKDIE